MSPDLSRISGTVQGLLQIETSQATQEREMVLPESVEWGVGYDDFDLDGELDSAVRNDIVGISVYLHQGK